MSDAEGVFMKVDGKPKPHDLVVKGNALVHASYVMERREKMLMWFVIWAYQQQRSAKLSLSCREIADFIGMNRSTVYTEVVGVARALRSRELLIYKPEKDRVGFCGFLSYGEYGKAGTGEIDVVITAEVLPHIDRFIEEMKIGFTKFEMGVIASLRSFYSLRLYEICRAMNYGSHKSEGWELTVEELRKRFGVYVVDGKTKKVLVDSYGDWRRFREKVLDKAVNEVNEASDLKVKYQLRKTGRDIVAVRFFVESNKAGAVVMNGEASDKDLLQRMVRLGVSPRMMKSFMDQYGVSDPGRLEYALKATEIAKKAGKARNAAAWFVDAVKKDRRAQGELFTPEQKAREKRLEAQEIARDAKLRRRPTTESDTAPISALLDKFQPSDELGQALAKMRNNMVLKAEKSGQQ